MERNNSLAGRSCPSTNLAAESPTPSTCSVKSYPQATTISEDSSEEVSQVATERRVADAPETFDQNGGANSQETALNSEHSQIGVSNNRRAYG
jgi:hypothetical protein